ncbi:MAG TPA: response regulator [Caulobacteraceae bacterium]|jgi:two-component system chemotaxis response regulator CheY|nr:response regulator [Caulobacteraceae bacterium]
MDEAGLRVLVVDDAALVRLYYRNALEAAGWQVDEALNGIEALEKLSGAAADLLIVDVNMPRMDGLSFLKVLRRQAGEAAFTPAVVISTEAGPQDVASARAAGANFYLVKPVDPARLVEVVGLICGTAP